MAKEYRNFTVGLDETTYNQLKDLAMLNNTSIRKYITGIVNPEFNKYKESISKLKGFLNSINSSNPI